MRFSIYQESRQGRRKYNQDRVAYCYSRDALLMVLADGMGGHLHGEVAAQIAVQYMSELFQHEAKPAVPDPVLFLSKGFTNAHHAIVDYSFDHDLPEAPRTTCVACLVQDGMAYWAHAGDSRLYLVRGGKLIAQTKDHSRVQAMVDEGLISEDEALQHPARNKIFSCLGGSSAPQIDFSRRTPVHGGDIIALATDGAWGPFTGDEMVRLLVSAPVLDVVPRLLDQAEAAGGEHCDNLTMIAMMWDEDYDDEHPGAISTRTMPANVVTTQMPGVALGRLPSGAVDLSDDEIERAIREINETIGKYSGK